MGEVVKINSGRDYKHLSVGKIPVYGTGGLMLYVNEALSTNQDAIGIGRKGTINKPYILKAPFWTVDTLFFVVPNININLYFVFNIFEKINWKAKDESTGVPSLSKLTISNTKIFSPNIEEQMQIGKLTKELDETITLLQRKINNLNKVKKGLLQKLFPAKQSINPRIRFNGFNQDWEQRQFSELVNKLSKTSASSSLPKIEFEDIISGEGRLNKDVSTKFDNRKGILFNENNILYGKLRPYLKNWLYTDFKGIALGDFWVFEANYIEPKFLYFLIQADIYQKAANDTSGTKMPRSDWQKVSSTKFYVPRDLEEQIKIGNLLMGIEETLTLLQKELEMNKQIKKGFLQKLFPKE